MDWTASTVEPLWPDALEAGVVSVPLDVAKQATLGELFGLPQNTARFFQGEPVELTPEQDRGLLSWIARTLLPSLLADQAAYDAGLFAALDDRLTQERSAGTPLEEMVDSLLDVAKLFGAAGLFDTYFGTWYGTGIVGATFQETAQSVTGTEAISPVLPYLQYWTRNDGRVRDNHQALHRFVAASQWQAWRVVMPPNGYRCRCQLVPIDFVTASARGYEGVFPNGTVKLSRFFDLGGPDEGFPKTQFV